MHPNVYIGGKGLKCQLSTFFQEVIDDISDMEEVNNSDMIRRKRTTNQNLDSDDGFETKVMKLKLILSHIQTLSDDSAADDF